MSAPIKVLGFALALTLAGCSGNGGDATGPNPEPPTNDPELPTPNAGDIQGSYVLQQINGSELGQLVTISNPDGTVIGLYRFQPTTLLMDGLQNFDLQLRYSDDKTPGGIDDEGNFKQAGPVATDGALPLTFSSDMYGDRFTGVALGNALTIKYDFDGDGQLDTSFGFRLVPGD
jgi:hypothetical protein